MSAGGRPRGRETVLVLDCGPQDSHLIARRVRELHVYSEVLPFDVPVDAVRQRRPIGIILSGGPDSVDSANAPWLDPALFDLGIPILGICYGMQLMAHQLQGRVVRAPHREYGPADLAVVEADPLFESSPRTQRVWMSHGDEIVEPPPDGQEILAAFLRAGCACRADWRSSSFEAETVQRAFQDDLHLPVRLVSAGDRFLEALRGVADPVSAAPPSWRRGLSIPIASSRP